MKSAVIKFIAHHNPDSLPNAKIFNEIKKFHFAISPRDIKQQTGIIVSVPCYTHYED